MNELGRLANDLIKEGEPRLNGGWPCHGDYPCMYQDDVYAVIRGYQELLRCLVKLLDRGAFYDATTVSNLEFAIEGEEHVNQLLMAIVKAKAALPKE